MFSAEYCLSVAKDVEKYGIKGTAKKLGVEKETIKRYLRQVRALEVNSKARILVFDIETAPIMAYVWGVWNQNISPDKIIKDWFILSWSAKWLNDNEIMSDIVTSKEAIQRNDKRICKSLYKLMDEADIVIAHYGNGFDIPKINARFITHGLTPPSPYQSIDTKQIASKGFAFTYNKLDWLATALGIPNKLSTDFNLWTRCIEGDQEALNYMDKYNRQDVLVLEEVYYKLRPWMKSHPNLGLYTDGKVCATCGSDHIHKKGSYKTSVNSYDAFVCEDCGAFSRKGKHKLMSVAR